MVPENLLKHYNAAYAESPEKAFCFAVGYGLFKAAEKLLKEGVDINTVGFNPETNSSMLLSEVAGYGLTRAVQFLLENGSHVNALGRNEMTPLMCACSLGKTKGEKIAYMLLEAGADIAYVRSGDNMTALTFSFENCSRGLIETLIEKGANVHGPKEARQTPLMIAARDNNVEAIELLLEHGADPQAQCTLSWAQGLTAEDLAKLEGKKKAYAYLRNYRLNKHAH